MYLNRDKFRDAYGIDVKNDLDYERNFNQDSSSNFLDTMSGMNKHSNDYFVHGGSRYSNEPNKRSIRRKLSLSSISHMWSR